MDAGTRQDHLSGLVLPVGPEEEAEGGEHVAVAGKGDGPVEGEAALGIPALHLAATERLFRPSQYLEEDEPGGNLRRLPIEGESSLEGGEETGLSGRMEQGRLAAKREGAKLEPLETGGETFVEGVGGADVNGADVARSLAGDPGLLDDVEVTVTTAVTELEYPTHSDATNAEQCITTVHPSPKVFR